MKKTNAVSRIVLVAIAVPALFALALFVPFGNHLPLVAIVLAFCAGSAIELSRMIEPEAGAARRAVAVALAALPSLAAYAASLAFPGSPLATRWITPMACAVAAGFILSAAPIALPRTASGIEASVRLAGANSLYIMYLGVLTSTIVALMGTPVIGGQLIVWYALVVFANDSFAWLVGVTLGRHRGLSTVSPNKSLEGFVAGLAGSVGAALAGPLVFPSVVPRSWDLLAVLGASCGVAVVIGDLFESALKRASGVKDSGSVVPGRGGMLDSFDSLLFTAPVFVAFLVAFEIVA